MSDFGASVYGLTTFQLILIRNYFSNFGTFSLVSEDSTAIFPYSKATC
jgi:hypothetical protein